MKRLIIFVLLAICFIGCKFYSKVDVVTISPHLIEELQDDIFICEREGMSYDLYTSGDGFYKVLCKGKIKGKEKERPKPLSCMDAYREYEKMWRRDIAEK